MNTAYNSTTTATDVTTTQTQQPEPVATEYYGYLDGRDPMQIGRIKKQLDRRIYADGKICTWAEYIAEGYEAGQLKAYKDEYTYAKKGRDLAYHEHKVTEWVIWTVREMERGNGVVANKTIVDYARYLIKLMEATPATAPQATEEDTATAPEEVTTAPEATAETPEKSEEEPAPATEATDDPEEVVFLKGAELDKVIAEYSERNNLDIEYQNKRYYFYATADGYIVKLDKNKPKSRLYIADEGPYYDSYRKGEITARTIFFEQNMNILSDYSRQRLESPVNCNVRRTITGDLSIDPFGKIEYSYDPTTGKSEGIPVKHPTTRELAIYVAARKAYEDDQRERLEKYWKRYGHKVRVNTYWADR